MPGKKVENGYRYGFNGMERDDELKGAHNSYDFGARIYDTRVGRWLAVDPVHHFWQSAYAGIDNSPIWKIDPDGRTGEVTIDKDKGTATVSSHLIFYVGPGSERDISPRRARRAARKAARSIDKTWNSTNGGSVEIEGEKYVAEFQITYEIVSFEEAENRFNLPKVSFKDNYIQLSSISETLSSNFGNTAIFNINQIEARGRNYRGHNYVAAHEYGHLMGWYDKSQKDNNHMVGYHDEKGHLSEDRTHSVPGIMLPTQASSPIEVSLSRKHGNPAYGGKYVKDGYLKNIRVVRDRDLSLLFKSPNGSVRRSDKSDSVYEVGVLFQEEWGRKGSEDYSFPNDSE